jgi:hypothetical protein
MPIYYFNIYNDDVTEDFEGTNLADDTAARAYAVSSARSLAADTVARGHLGLSHWIEIADEAREPMGIVTFADAVDVRS